MQNDSGKRKEITRLKVKSDIMIDVGDGRKVSLTKVLKNKRNQRQAYISRLKKRELQERRKKRLLIVCLHLGIVDSKQLLNLINAAE